MHNWEITGTQNEAAWFDDYIEHVLSVAPPSLPPHDQHIGLVETHWHQVEPGIVYVAANPDQGTPDDRRFAEQIVLSRLTNHGFKRSVVDLDGMEKTSQWQDVEDKARRLIQSGQVQLLRNGAQTIVGQVQGDHGNYKTEIARQDPNSQSITGSHCDCDWGQFQNLPRTRQWKRFQNRPCAHILATYWLSKSIPIDEQRAPGDQGEAGQMSLFDQGSGGQAPGSGSGIMRGMPGPNAWMMQPGVGYNAPGAQMPTQTPQAPAPAEVLPQYPLEGMEDAMANMPPVNPASIPGQRPGPTPTDPIQYPGGTFSKVAVDQQYQNGEIVRLNQGTTAILVGRSEDHGAGQPTEIPAGSLGEVLGTDPATGMVNVLFMGKQFDQNTFFEPFGAQAWCWQSELSPSGQTPPGPAIRRT